MDRSPKCSRCSERVDVKADVLPKEEWPSPVWPLYKCSSCGATLEEDNRSLVYQSFLTVLIIAVTQTVGRTIGFVLSGGSELAVDILGWAAMAAGLFWYWSKPMRLGERGQYAKQR
jgi:DNA-directed RNA polymerase subunit RPC12/RpoP